MSHLQVAKSSGEPVSTPRVSVSHYEDCPLCLFGNSQAALIQWQLETCPRRAEVREGGSSHLPPTVARSISSISLVLATPEVRACGFIYPLVISFVNDPIPAQVFPLPFHFPLPTHTRCWLVYHSSPAHHLAICLVTQTKLNTILLVYDYPTAFCSVLDLLASLPIQCQFHAVQPFGVALGIVKTHLPCGTRRLKAPALPPHSSSPTRFPSHLKTHHSLHYRQYLQFRSMALPESCHKKRG